MSGKACKIHLQHIAHRTSHISHSIANNPAIFRSVSFDEEKENRRTVSRVEGHTKSCEWRKIPEQRKKIIISLNYTNFLTVKISVTYNFCRVFSLFPFLVIPLRSNGFSFFSFFSLLFYFECILCFFSGNFCSLFSWNFRVNMWE